jgi:hypothetical protein
MASGYPAAAITLAAFAAHIAVNVARALFGRRGDGHPSG